ncbi:hypothetical protein GF343_05755 [Candidatus Woesearchaeota archaeon]|nr:hypothetical protein [Candidatus Woesearchaeota archaeon]
MVPENFDFILKQAMDILYAKLDDAWSCAQAWEQSRKKTSGVRGIFNLVTNPDDYFENKPRVKQLETQKEYLTGQMAGASNAIIDFIEDNLPPALAEQVITAARGSVESYLRQNKSKIKRFSDDSTTVINELGSSIETAMHDAAQRYYSNQ